MEPETNPNPQQPPKQPETPHSFTSSRRRKLILLLAIPILVLGTAVACFLLLRPTSAPPQKAKDTRTHISIATIWSAAQLDGVYEDSTLKAPGLNYYLEEYKKLHPDITFDVQTVPSEDYFSKLIGLHDADAVPDIYQAYAPWGKAFVARSMLAKPPQDIADDVTANYSSAASTQIAGQVWGIPTEINNYMLVYNKKLFSAAGISAPPTTWNDLVNDAVKLTKKDTSGNITQYGFAFAHDDDELIGDTFLAQLASNNGTFLTPDGSRSNINSPEAIETLTQQVRLFQQGATSNDADLYDFTSGNIAMIIVPPWVHNQFREAMGEDFANVAVAPLPILKKRATLQYSWFTGVMEKSHHKEAAWQFLKWFTSDVQPSTGTTRSSDLLAANIGTIPSRQSDVSKEPSLKNDFMAAFVSDLPYAAPAPSFSDFEDARSILSKQVQGAWFSKQTPMAALDNAAQNINTLLEGH